MTRALVLLCALPSAAEPVTSLRDNGDPNERIDIVILGDGFTQGEQAAFQAYAASLNDQIFADEPFREYAAFFNVHAVEVVSNESGADHPELDTESDTALGAYYNCAEIERLICLDWVAVEEVLERSVDAAARDVVLVLVNDTKYGGSGGRYAVSSIHDSLSEIMLHEIGHAFGWLADEYTDGECSGDTEPTEANVTRITARDEIKWNTGGGPPRGWIEPGRRLPSVDQTPSVPGLYEGAKYCEQGVYRPTFDSKMRSLNRPWDAINRAELVKAVYRRVGPVQDVRLPTEDLTFSHERQATFLATITRPTPDTTRVAWLLDGDRVGTADELVLQLTGLAPGSHTLTLVVSDNTDMVRHDPDRLLRQELSWDLTIEQAFDTDQDGLPDAYEVANGLDPADPADAEEDADADGLTNAAEYVAGTDPRRADTDGDGFGDALELADGTDPLDADDCATCMRSLAARFAPALIAALGSGAVQRGQQANGGSSE